MLSLLLLFLAARCEQLATQAVEAEAIRPGEVAFDLAGQGEAAIVVPVRINGEGPFSFVLDTGATLTCLDRQLSERLGLEPAAGMRGIAGGVGSIGAVDLVRIDRIEVGEAAATDLVACALDLSAIGDVGIEAEGLLGLNFLRGFHVAIDFERSVLTLETAESRNSSGDASRSSP